MTPKERLALALQYQRPSLGDVVPVAGVDNAPTAGPAPLSFMDRLREGSAGAGRGLESQLEGYKQMAVHPIDSARAMGQGVVDIARDPSKIVDALKAMGEKATSGPAGMGEVLGENLSLNPRKLIEALSHPNVREMTVYHGTPHEFPAVEGAPLGKFDASKIGTGEGAQAFGHGLYLAENEKVAGGYRSALSKDPFPDKDPRNGGWMFYNHRGEDAARKYLADVLPADQVENALKDVKSAQSGSLYTVDLPDEHIERMLDWDKPLSEQPIHIQNAARKFLNKELEYSKIDDPAWGELGKPYDPMQMTGGHFISSLTSRFGRESSNPLAGSKAVSEALRKEGIPGTKYLDEGSRDVKKGTRNFVVFPGEEHNIKILERNGEKASPQKISEALQSMPRKADVKSVATYQGEHSPPGPDSGAPLHDLTGNGVYPSDFYSHNQIRYYGTGDPTDHKSFAIANEMKGNPDKQVTMYRAVPVTRSNAEKIAELEAQKAAYLRRNIVPAGQPEKGFYDRASNEIERLKKLPEQEASVPSINEGDWVTINRDYAKAHGEGALNGEYKIVTKKVKAKDLYTNGDSIHEFGYWPTDKGVK